MIKFGDTGLIVDYIQNFLKDNYNKSIHLSNEYDYETHKHLINYFKLPYILSANDMKDLMHSTFLFRENVPPNKLINGGGIWNFDFEMTDDYIKFYNRPTTDSFVNGSAFLSQYIEVIDSLCKQNGWRVSYYTRQKYNTNSVNKKIEFILKQDTRKQLLPTKDLIKMINFVSGDYLYNKCFLDDNNKYHGYIQSSDNYKIALIPAVPGETYTIAHGYQNACEIAIAYSEHTLKELKQEGYGVNNIVSRLENSDKNMLGMGDYEIYTIPENSKCTYLLVQMPYKNSLTTSSQKIKIKLGDIDGDGKTTGPIDLEGTDLYNLDKYVTAIENEEQLPFILTGRNLIAANVNQDRNSSGEHIINRLDVEFFKIKYNVENYNKTHNESHTVDLGEIIYEENVELPESDYDKLLVMYGNVEKNNIGLNKEKNIANIPYDKFYVDSWALHEDIIPYFLGSAIHKFSNIEDIRWLQELIQKINPNYKGKYWGYYDESKDFISDDRLMLDTSTLRYKYYTNGLYTGYILEKGIGPQNGYFLKEANNSKSNIRIVNGRMLINNVWNGKYVLENGQITTEYAKNSLKEFIKEFQLQTNAYKILQKSYFFERSENKSFELIRWCNGFVDPLTEKLLNDYIEKLLK